MFYQDLAIVALFIFLFSLFGSRFERYSISGPMLAVVVGLLMGPALLNIMQISPGSKIYKTLTEFALAIVLFTDASKTNLRVLEHSIKIPLRLLLIGLPLTIILGTFIGALTFPDLTWIELGLLATMLAPTDAALGKSVVTNSKVPSNIREALNVESGLNDGISVPILYLLLAIFSAHSIQDVSVWFGLGLFIKEIGIGVIVGLVIAAAGARLIKKSYTNKWMADTWKPIVIVALAFCCFTIAQMLDSSGFIACFTAGLFYGIILKKKNAGLITAAVGTSDALSLLTWFVFGSVVVVSHILPVTWKIILYAILSLTLVRMIPVMISLISEKMSFRAKLFMAWFGPRGLASIVFAIIIFDVNLPNRETIISTTILTILMSVFLHGLTANSLIDWLNKGKIKTALS